MSFTYRVNNKLRKIANLTRDRIFGNGVKAFWWTGKKNFGDLLTPELFTHFGYAPIHAAPGEAQVIGVGSLLHMIPTDYSGTVLGTGMISDSPMRFENAHFAVVRGELTKKNLSIPADTPTGDMGLLAQHLAGSTTVSKKYSVGLIPHFVDKAHPWIGTVRRQLGDSGCVIDVQNTATNVIRQVNACELIISSSLHGIIVSDALGIPNIWIELSSQVIGDGFKFWDHNSSLNYEQPPVKISPSIALKWIERQASNKDLALIKRKAEELEVIFKEVMASSKGNISP